MFERGKDYGVVSEERVNKGLEWQGEPVGEIYLAGEF